MKLLVNVKIVGFLTYIRVFLMHLIWGFWYKEKRDFDKCKICGKTLTARRFEVVVDRSDLNYEIESDGFYCVTHAMQILMRYKEVET